MGLQNKYIYCVEVQINKAASCKQRDTIYTCFGYCIEFKFHNTHRQYAHAHALRLSYHVWHFGAERLSLWRWGASNALLWCSVLLGVHKAGKHEEKDFSCSVWNLFSNVKAVDMLYNNVFWFSSIHVNKPPFWIVRVCASEQRQDASVAVDLWNLGSITIFLSFQAEKHCNEDVIDMRFTIIHESH